jgi:hypothetical protein
MYGCLTLTRPRPKTQLRIHPFSKPRLLHGATMSANARNACAVRINGIEDSRDRDVRVIFKENYLVNGRPNERRLWSLFVSMPIGRPNKRELWNLLLARADSDAVELNRQIRV